MKKQCGNFEVEIEEATSCGEPFVICMHIRTLTVKRLTLSAPDARDLHYLLSWAIGGQYEKDK